MQHYAGRGLAIARVEENASYIGLAQTNLAYRAGDFEKKAKFSLHETLLKRF